MPITLPIIVLESIVDQIDPETNARLLASCALVSHDLLPRSRFILYSTLYIVNIRRLNGVLKSLKSVPALAELVRAVQVSVHRFPAPFKQRNCDAPLHNIVLARLLPYLPPRPYCWTFIGRAPLISVHPSRNYDQDADLGTAVHLFRARTLTSLGECFCIRSICLTNLELGSLDEYANILMACRGLSIVRLGPSIKVRRARNVSGKTEGRLALACTNITELQVWHEML